MSKKRKGLLQRILMLMLVVCMVCGNGITALADEAVASTMRLTKTEGTVSVTNKNGRDMGTMADMKLFNGYHLTTAQKSYAWMNLDDHKLVKLDAVSEAEIQKKGKDLEVLLNSGNLLFNVTESLKADETLNVRTSTMVTGIRGTCGWVKVLDASRTQVHILEGQVECYVMDPVSGQYKSVTLRSGETAEFVVYDQTRVGDKCDILINRFSEKDIPGFVAVELMDNSDLRDRITGSMNIDMNWIFGNGPTILDQDQKNVEQKFVPLNEAVKQQDHKVTKDPLFGNDDDDDDNDGGGSGGGSSTVTPPADIEEVREKVLTVTEAETDDQLNYYLSMNSMEELTIIPSDDDGTLNLSTTTTISDGQLLKLDGVGLVVGDPDSDESVELRINGKLNVSGNVVNNGTITNTNLNSFVIGGSLHNADIAIIENTGKIDAAEGMLNDGTIISSGRLIGAVTVSPYGTLELLADDEFGTLEGTLTVQGRPDYIGYATLYKNMPDELVFDGGTVELAGAEVDVMEISNGSVIVSNGGQINEVVISTTGVRNGVLTVDGGNVNNVKTEEGILNVESGTIGIAEFTAGSLIATGGSVDFVGASPNTLLTVSGGNIGAIDLNGAQYYNGDETISIVGAKGTIEVEGGKVKLAALSDYDEQADGDVLTKISGDIVEKLEQSSGTVEISGGKVTTATLINTAVTMTEGEVTTLDSKYYEGQDMVVSGGKINDIQVTWLQTGQVYPNLIVKGSASIISATLGERVGLTMSGGAISELTAEDEVILDNGTVVEMTINGGNLTVNGGAHGSVILNSTSGSMNAGTITNGLSVNGGTVDNAATFSVYGGTISSGEATAAICVDAVVPDPYFPTMAEGFELAHVMIWGGIIDGQSNSAIEVTNGEVVIDMLDTSTEAEPDTMIPVIKGNNPSEFFVVPADADTNLRIWTDEYLADTLEYVSVQKNYTQNSYLFLDQGDNEYSLNRLTNNFEEALTTLTGGEYLLMSKDTELDLRNQYDIVLNPIVYEPEKPAVLDLNGCKLTIGNYLVVGFEESNIEEECGLIICDSKDTGVLNVLGMKNYGILTFDSVQVVLESWEAINNYADLNIHNSVINSYDYGAIENYQGNLNVTGNSVIRSSKPEQDTEGSINTVTMYSGSATFKGNSESEPIEVICDGDMSSYAIFMAYDGDAAPSLNLELENTTVSAGEGIAIYADVNSAITMKAGTMLESDSDTATLYCEAEIERKEIDAGQNEDPIYDYVCTYPQLTLNAGSIINENPDGYAIYWNSVGYFYAAVENPDWYYILDDSSLDLSNLTIKTRLDNSDTDGMENLICEYYDFSGGYSTGNDGSHGMRYPIPSNYTVIEDNGYWKLQKVTSRSLLASFFNFVQTPSDHESVATGSNATASNATATDSNASGLPEGTAKAAIPMAAVLFGLMYAVPRLLPNDRKRERKER